MKKKSYALIVALIMILSITFGYAFLSANLTINGTSSINNASWDIHFENIVVSSGSVTASEPIIDTNRTTVTYEVTLSKPGDFYEFTVDAKNDGSIDAMVDTVISTLNNNEITVLPTYLNYSVTYRYGNQILSKQDLLSGSKETYKVRVEFEKDIHASDLPSTPQTLNFSFSVNFVQKDDTSIPMHHPVSFATDSWDTILYAVINSQTDVYNIGDTKEVDMGTYGTHTVRVVNKSEPDECLQDGFSNTACGFVVEFADIIVNHNMNTTNTNVGGWRDSELRSFLNNDLFSSLPQQMRKVITTTLVISGHGNTSGEVNYDTLDRLYLLSNKEINYNITYDTAGNNTRVLDYYVDHNDNASRIKQLNGSNAYWWLRTAYSNTNVSFFCVGNTGTNNGNISSYVRGVSPAFRIYKGVA